MLLSDVRNGNSWLLFLCCAVSCALFVVAYFQTGTHSQGGFGMTSDDASATESCEHDLLKHVGSSKVNSKFVLIILDGFRYDYFERHRSSMPFLHGMVGKGDVANYAWTFRTKAGMPTVTMPQIKSMMTGNHATYIDLLWNFGTDGIAIKQDSLINQLKNHGKHIHFYGDDTWLKLYPQSFHEPDGTHSFYVMDYTEVDNNVTRHISSNLNANQPDVLILHYLGVDHIGHSKRPDTAEGTRLLDQKLLEMDEIVQNLYKNTADDTLFLISGDHGMDSSGVHGGSAESEVFTFSMILFKESMATNSKHDINIVDITPTLAPLLGIPIPENAIGLCYSQEIQVLRAAVERLVCKLGERSRTAAEALKRAKAQQHLWGDAERVLELQSELARELDEMSKNVVSMAEACAALTVLVIGLGAWFYGEAAWESLNYGLVPLLVPTFMLFSSSYIEEEYLVWFFLGNTFFLYKLAKIFVASSTTSPDLLHWLKITTIYALLSRWNNTGILFKDWEDFGDIIGNHGTLSAAMAVCSAFAVLGRENKLLQSALAIYRFRALEYVVDVGVISQQRMVLAAILVDLVINCKSVSGSGIWPTVRRRTSMYLALALFRPETVPVVCGHIWLSRRFGRPGSKVQLESSAEFTFVNYMLAQSCYYQLGNCFSPNCVDMGVIYFGVDNLYKPIAAAYLTSVTFLGFILYGNSADKNQVVIKVFTLFLYFIIALNFRDHLSVWTVFSPKIFTEIASTLAFLLL